MLQGGHERLTDRQTDGQTDRQTGWIQYTLPNFVAGSIKICGATYFDTPNLLTWMGCIPKRTDPYQTSIIPYTKVLFCTSNVPLCHSTNHAEYNHNKPQTFLLGFATPMIMVADVLSLLQISNYDITEHNIALLVIINPNSRCRRSWQNCQRKFFEGVLKHTQNI